MFLGLTLQEDVTMRQFFPSIAVMLAFDVILMVIKHLSDPFYRKAILLDLEVQTVYLAQIVTISFDFKLLQHVSLKLAIRK